MKTETKAVATPQEVSRDLALAFEAFKEANDQRLQELERKGSADRLIEDKLARIDKVLDRLMIEGLRPTLGGQAERKGEEAHVAAWGAYLRKGDDSGLARIDVKALTQGTEAQGGYVAPPELDRLIEARLMKASPMRQIATVRQTSATVFKKPVSLGAAANWAVETTSRSETTAPTLSLLSFPAAELYAMPAATQALLDDAYADIDDWLAEEVEIAFAAQESAAFVTGDGLGKPKGFLDHETVAQASHQWGKIGYITTGVSAGFGATSPGDALLELIYAPAAQHRINGRFVMNRRTLSAVRRLKDGQNNYLWRVGEAGQPSTVFGYPVTEIEDMPDIGANSMAIAFGDFRKGYLIVDRQGARVLRDPFSAKPYVLFYTTKRVGGGVQNFDAIKLLKFGVS